jgi:hypothetical protein
LSGLVVPDQLLDGPARVHTDGLVPNSATRIGSIDLTADRFRRLRAALLLYLPRAQSARARMRGIEDLVETYLTAERDLVTAVDAAGGSILLPDGRTVTTGRAEFDSVPGRQRRRAWVLVRRNAPMPPRR